MRRIALAVAICIGLGTSSCSIGRFNFAFKPNVSSKLWKPNPEFFCNGLDELSQPSGQNAFYISLMTDAAPTAPSHTAMLKYYDDFTHLNPTSADLAKVVASDSCPMK